MSIRNPFKSTTWSWIGTCGSAHFSATTSISIHKKETWTKSRHSFQLLSVHPRLIGWGSTKNNLPFFLTQGQEKIDIFWKKHDFMEILVKTLQYYSEKLNFTKSCDYVESDEIKNRLRTVWTLSRSTCRMPGVRPRQMFASAALLCNIGQLRPNSQRGLDAGSRVCAVPALPDQDCGEQGRSRRPSAPRLLWIRHDEERPLDDSHFTCGLNTTIEFGFPPRRQKFPCLNVLSQLDEITHFEVPKVPVRPLTRLLQRTF